MAHVKNRSPVLVEKLPAFHVAYGFYACFIALLGDCTWQLSQAYWFGIDLRSSCFDGGSSKRQPGGRTFYCVLDYIICMCVRRGGCVIPASLACGCKVIACSTNNPIRCSKKKGKTTRKEVTFSKIDRSYSRIHF